MTRKVYKHGIEVNSCMYCNARITEKSPGVELIYRKGFRKHIEHICKTCFEHKLYQLKLMDLIASHKIGNINLNIYKG